MRKLRHRENKWFALGVMDGMHWASIRTQAYGSMAECVTLMLPLGQNCFLPGGRSGELLCRKGKYITLEGGRKQLLRNSAPQGKMRYLLVGNGLLGGRFWPHPPGLKHKALGSSSQAGLAAPCPLSLTEVARLIYRLCPGHTLPSVNVAVHLLPIAPSFSSLPASLPNRFTPWSSPMHSHWMYPVSSLAPPKSSSTYHTHILLTYSTFNICFSVLCRQIFKGLT